MSSDYPTIVERILFFKSGNFKVFYGGPVVRSDGGVQWIMPISFENNLFQTRSTYEIAFVGCTPKEAEGAEVIFIDVSDADIKLKNVYSKDYQLFSSLLSGNYIPNKYVVVRASGVSNVYYPDIFISSTGNRVL